MPANVQSPNEEDVLMGEEEKEEYEMLSNEDKDSSKQAFRSELKRPDLKGTFRCSICQKVFCHSSSLSRHRMQAHFKSYKCTLCRKEITSNETLRAHMYKQHQISRMFMCRCCNWAFPDKTSLHMHIQAKEEGKSVSVPVIGKGLPPGAESPTPSAFAPLQTINNNTILANHRPVLPTPLPFFAPSPMGQPAEELMARLRERILMNQMLISQQTTNGFGVLNWLSQLPKPVIPDDTKKEIEEDDDDEIEVEKSETPKAEEKNDEQCLSRQAILEKTPDSPEGGSGSSTDGFSPSHTRVSTSPLDMFKKENAFHQTVLNLDASVTSSLLPHVSPSETHSTASPPGEQPSCYDCALNKSKIVDFENKLRYLEARNASMQSELAQALSAVRSSEQSACSLRSALLECQEESLRFARSENTSDPQAVLTYINQILKLTLSR